MVGAGLRDTEPGRNPRCVEVVEKWQDFFLWNRFGGPESQSVLPNREGADRISVESQSAESGE